MSFPRYAEYKDSGVEWLGEVPEHWNVLTAKRVSKIFVPQRNKPQLNTTADGISWVTMEDMKTSEIITTNLWVTEEEAKMAGSKILPKGSVISSCVGNFGVASINMIDVIINQQLQAFIPSHSINPIFFLHCTRCAKSYFEQVGTAATLIYVNQQGFENMPLAVPPKNEQELIAAFLDHETAKLDNLINEQKTLIELLKEKRQAVISHAVTKGLNPNAPMKDSGVEWLGKVPEGWGVKKLKYLGEAIIGLTYSPDDVVDEGEGVLVLRSSNIQNKKLAFDDNVYVCKDIPEKLRTQKNDILICSRNGSRALIGKNTLIHDDAVGLSFGAFMCIYRSKYNEYLSKVFNSSLFEYQSGTFLTATINQLTTGNLNGFEVPLPPKEERNAIVAFLDQETTKIDTLITKAESAIQLLQERRTALISAAVTGKIDVRHWKPN